MAPNEAASRASAPHAGAAPEALVRFGRDEAPSAGSYEPLLTGGGHYSDDLALPGQAHGVFLRAPVAHAVLTAVDGDAALRHPGVLAIITGADLARAGLGAIPPAAIFKRRDGKDIADAAMPPLAAERL